jgi:hypothetical protein
MTMPGALLGSECCPRQFTRVQWHPSPRMAPKKAPGQFLEVFRELFPPQSPCSERVGVEGVEPPTSCASCMRSNQLSYTPEQRTTLSAGRAGRR